MMKCEGHTVSPQSALAAVIVNHSTEGGSLFFFFVKVYLLGSLANGIIPHEIIRR